MKVGELTSKILAVLHGMGIWLGGMHAWEGGHCSMLGSIRVMV